MTLPCHYSPTADRAPSAAELERAWLEDISASVRGHLDELVKGYGPTGGDTDIEEAIGNIESALHSIWRRQCKLDDGGA